MNDLNNIIDNNENIFNKDFYLDSTDVSLSKVDQEINHIFYKNINIFDFTDLTTQETSNKSIKTENQILKFSDNENESEKIQLNDLLKYFLDLDNINPTTSRSLDELREMFINKTAYSEILKKIKQLDLLIKQRFFIKKMSTIFAGLIKPSIYSIFKQFAHEFTLSGELKIKEDKLFSVEGSNSGLMHARLFQSVQQFFSQSLTLDLSIEKQSQLLYCLKQSIIFSAVVDTKNPEYIELAAQEALNDYRSGKIVSIGTGWIKHAVEVTLQKDYFCYTNRGEKGKGEDYEDGNANLKIFKINHPELINLEFFKKLISESNLNLTIEWLESNKTDALRNFLGLQLIHEVFKQDQKTGNCSWANTKGGFHAALILLNLNLAIEQKENVLEVVLEVTNQSQKTYKEWSAFSRKDIKKLYQETLAYSHYLEFKEHTQIEHL